MAFPATGVLTPGVYQHLEAPRVRLRRLAATTAALAARDLTAQYRRTLLGPAWAVAQPLLFTALFLFVRGAAGFESGDEGGVPYAAFALAGLVPWAFLANAVIRAAPSVALNAGIVRKSALPRVVFPLAAVIVSLVDFAIGGVLLGVVLAGLGLAPGPAVAWLPALVLLEALLALGAGLLFAAAGAYRRDVVLAAPILLPCWLLATPVLFPLARVPARFALVTALNPMTGILEGFRSVLLHGAAPDLDLLGLSAASILALWLVAWPVFRRASRHFADVL